MLNYASHLIWYGLTCIICENGKIHMHNDWYIECGDYVCGLLGMVWFDVFVTPTIDVWCLDYVFMVF